MEAPLIHFSIGKASSFCLFLLVIFFDCLFRSGRTTLSASGILLLPGSLDETPPIIDHVCEIHKHAGAVIVTCASVIEPFLITEQRNDPRQVRLEMVALSVFDHAALRVIMFFVFVFQLFSPKLIHDAHIDVLFEVYAPSSLQDYRMN